MEEDSYQNEGVQAQQPSPPDKFNVFQIYTENGLDILPNGKVEQNINTLSDILVENINELKTIMGSDDIIVPDDSDTVIDYEKLNDNFTFNGLDITPSDALRGGLDSFLFTNSGVVSMPITNSNQMSQFMDFLSQDTGTRYLSSYFKYADINIQSPVAAGQMEISSVSNDDVSPEEVTEKVKLLFDNINFHINKISSSKDISLLPKIYGDLFNCIVMFLSDFDKLSDEEKEGYLIEYTNEINSYVNYVSVYGIILNMFPTFMTFALSREIGYTNPNKLMFDSKYQPIFYSIYGALSASLVNMNKDKTKDNIDVLINQVINLIKVDKETKKYIYNNLSWKSSNLLRGSYELLVELYKIFQTDKMEIVKEPELAKGLKDTHYVPAAQIDFSNVFSEYRPSDIENKKRGRSDSSYFEDNQVSDDGMFGNLFNSPYKRQAIMVGGSCERINLRNELLSVKLSYEWGHDFGPGTERAPKATGGDYQYPQFYDSGNIFYNVKEGWDRIIGGFDVRNSAPNDVLDKTIFEKLIESDRKHDEPRYMSDIVDSLMIHCQHMKDNFMYIPVAEFKFATDNLEPKEMVGFFEKVFKYYGNQRMFIKPADDITRVVHLSITSDNTPIGDLNDDKSLGYMLQDMKTIGGLEIALSNYRKGLYGAWENIVLTQGSDQAKVEAIFDAFKTATNSIIGIAKDNEYDIKTPANLIDPITTGAFDSVNQVIQQNNSDLDSKPVFQNVIQLATIYGMNQLLNFWINNKRVVTGYTLSGQASAVAQADKVDTITFTLSNNETFDWCVGDSTVNIICGALINIQKNIPNGTNIDTVVNMDDIEDLTKINAGFLKVAQQSYPGCDQRWTRLYTIAKQIMFYTGFKYPKTIRNFMVIITYLKSCGDEFQRLTCEFINYAMALPPAEYASGYLLEYLPQGITLPEQVTVKGVFENIMYLLTQDRILIGESIEKDTPVFTSLKCPNEAFYDDAEAANDFIDIALNVKGSNISKTTSGILSNRRKEISAAAERDYPKEITKNVTKIENLMKQIVLKMTGSLDIINNNQIDIHSKIILYPDGSPIALPAANSINNSEPAQVSAAEAILSQQQPIIDTLSKISLAITYYATGSERISPNIYEKLIEGEILKAVSLTINTDLLDTITLENSCRVPRTVKALKTLIENMYNQPEIVDKLIDSYERANELFLQKLDTYKDILNNNNIEFQKVLEKLFRGVVPPIDLKVSIITAKYDTYKSHIVANKSNFSKNILQSVDSLLQAEIRKLGRMRDVDRKNYGDVDSEKTNLDAVIAELNQLQTERERLLEEQKANELKEQAAIAAAASPAPASDVSASNSGSKKNAPAPAPKAPSKTFLQKLIKPFKQQATTISKGLSKIGEMMQKVVEKKKTFETKIAGKTKVFGLETYKSIVDMLKQRSSSISQASASSASARGGDIVSSFFGKKSATKKLRRIKKNTKKMNKRNKCKNSKKCIKRHKGRKTKNNK